MAVAWLFSWAIYILILDFDCTWSSLKCMQTSGVQRWCLRPVYDQNCNPFECVYMQKKKNKKITTTNILCKHCNEKGMKIKLLFVSYIHDNENYRPTHFQSSSTANIVDIIATINSNIIKILWHFLYIPHWITSAIDISNSYSAQKCAAVWLP